MTTAGEPWFLGLDVGCRFGKGVAIDAAGTVRAQVCRPASAAPEGELQALRTALEQQLPAAAAVAAVVTTGAGRSRAPVGALRRTGVSCCARAAQDQFARSLDVVDLGGHGCTLIQVDAAGHVGSFLQQRHYAAATGAFLEQVARQLGLPLARLGELAAVGAPESRLRDHCPLFAAEEAAARVRSGEPLADLCRAALVTLAEAVQQQGPLGEFVVLVGGVAAHLPLLGTLLAAATGGHVEIPARPDLFGALGAALIARDGAAGSS